ncbi:MAG: hypothetical protein ABR881_19740 [Candidatus Sulfotelmatobacter sp.]|jgi:pyruvate/2-oxoacid:ferredoxin oxidoreductase alpha subunit
MTGSRYAVLSGNIAMAMGGAAAGVKFYCAYPMSPSTGVLHWMAAHARKAGIMVRQVEDEIGVVNMAIGAAHAGVRSMCATSGGGFALMSEGLGLSAMMETPVVVIDCQRAGPSTGVPTKTEQGDLWQMLGAAFGDYPRAIAAPLDIGDCFKLIPEIFNIADRFQCPGIVLCDLLLSEGRLSVDSGFELRHGIQFLECRGERIRKTPDRSRPKFLVLWFEVEVMHGPRKMLGSFQLSLHKGLGDDHLCSDIGQFASLLGLHLFAHGLEVALHSVNPYRDAVDQREGL